MGKILRSQKDIEQSLKQNIRNFSYNYNRRMKQVLYDNTKELWYDDYNEKIYERMGDNGGYLGAIERAQVEGSSGVYNFGAYFDLDKVDQDIRSYSTRTSDGRTKTRYYGRHYGYDEQSRTHDSDYINGVPVKEWILDRMENDGLPRGHENAGHMMEATAEQLESELEDTNMVSTYFNTGLTGIDLVIEKIKKVR